MLEALVQPSGARSLRVTPPQPSGDGRTAIVAVIPQTGPTDEETVDLVRALREDLPPVAESTGTDIALTGVTALGIDISDTLEAALPTYLAMVWD